MAKEGFNPLKVSITGIDGAGKSTVTRLIAAELGQEQRVARISRPSYTIVDGVKKGRYQKLLGAVDGLHAIADRTENPRYVLGVNALNVVLQGRVIEPGLIRKVQPDIVLGSRDYLIDPSVYAIFYSRKLGKRDMDSRLDYMQRVSGMNFRDVIFFLTVPPDEAVERIERRIALERQDPTRPEREKWRHMHEQPEHLARLQHEYTSALEVAQQRSNAKVFELDTSKLGQEEVASFVAATLRDFLGSNNPISELS